MPMRGAEAPEETRKGVGRWCRGRKCRFDGRHGNRQGACRCGESDFCAHHRTIFPWIIRKKSRHGTSADGRSQPPPGPRGRPTAPPAGAAGQQPQALLAILSALGSLASAAPAEGGARRRR